MQDLQRTGNQSIRLSRNADFMFSSSHFILKIGEFYDVKWQFSFSIEIINKIIFLRAK